jgi:hypothetical protein
MQAAGLQIALRLLPSALCILHSRLWPHHFRIYRKDAVCSRSGASQEPCHGGQHVVRVEAGRGELGPVELVVSPLQVPPRRQSGEAVSPATGSDADHLEERGGSGKGVIGVFRQAASEVKGGFLNGIDGVAELVSDGCQIFAPAQLGSDTAHLRQE